jgi:cobalamin biosynthetic protein CobC
MLEHGGNLIEAAQRYAIPLNDWLDLSTGINPQPYPVPEVPASIWQRLPQINDGLEQAACDYYRVNELLPVAGSQSAIQALPLLRSKSVVGIYAPSYAEYAHAWLRAGHELVILESVDAIQAQISQLDVLIIINPNNPDGKLFSVEQLLEWHRHLMLRSGWLIVDEAFIDTTPAHSITAYAQQSGLIVLRSLGKFFGLAGVRLGFVIAEEKLLSELSDVLGPWTVNGPARWIAMQALADRQWQDCARQQLQQQSEKLILCLKQYDFSHSGGCSLFQYVKTSQAKLIRDQLASQGIWVRYFAENNALRFGLPPSNQWQRLEHALLAIRGSFS